MTLIVLCLPRCLPTFCLSVVKIVDGAFDMMIACVLSHVFDVQFCLSCLKVSDVPLCSVKRRCKHLGSQPIRLMIRFVLLKG